MTARNYKNEAIKKLVFTENNIKVLFVNVTLINERKCTIIS